MAEYTANALQTVNAGGVILFTETAINGNASIIHREGSGLVTLRAVSCCQRRARFRITFGANMGLPAGGTAGPITAAIAISGEPDSNTSMEVTPAAVSEYFNVSRTTTIDVPAECCTNISVENTSTVPVDFKEVSLIVDRIA